jgi:TonB family protein
MTEAWTQWEGHLVNGKFQLKKYLGGSDESAVFLTEDPGREPQPAAIKLIAAGPGNAELQLARWGVAQRLPHPHLIRLLHTGRCRLDSRELIFAVMEYAEENLAQVLPQRALTPQEAREMLAPTLGALAFLHGQGYVHGHLAPANVMAIKDQLKLTSDSMCRIGENVPDSAKPTVYDPPEMAGGVRSPAADVWSLGMTLTEVLTQRLPSWTAQDQPADPVVPENLPAPFQEIVRGCLRRDPGRRFTIAEIGAWVGLRLPAGPLQPPARTAEAKPLPEERSTVPGLGTIARAASAAQRSEVPGSAASPQAESPVQRFAFPGAVAVLALAALIALLGLLRRQPEPRPHAAAVKAQQKPQAQEPTAARPSRQTATKSSPSAPSSAKTSHEQPAASANSIPPAPASQMKPSPAGLRSAASTVAPVNRGPQESAVVQQVLPDVPQSASNTIHGTVRVSVRINVDPSGTVEGAELDSPGPSRYFARLALQSAQGWKFAPSSEDAAREFVLHFEFRNSGPRAFATRAGG